MGFGASKGLILGLCLALGLMAAPAQADDDTPYTVSKIAVDVTAKNAVAAKAKAMADAQKRGIDTVLRRVVPFSFSAKLPDLQPQQVETLVNGMAIRKEQYSTTRYIATLDVIFNEQGVKELLASLGIPTSEERAPMISILPLVIDGNKVKSVNEPWRQAWLDLDLSHGLTPANVLQPRPELEAGMVRAVLAGDAGAFAAVQRDYGSAPLDHRGRAEGGGRPLRHAARRHRRRRAHQLWAERQALPARRPRRRRMQRPSPMRSWRIAGRRRGLHPTRSPRR